MNPVHTPHERSSRTTRSRRLAALALALGKGEIVGRAAWCRAWSITDRTFHRDIRQLLAWGFAVEPVPGGAYRLAATGAPDGGDRAWWLLLAAWTSPYATAPGFLDRWQRSFCDVTGWCPADLPPYRPSVPPTLAAGPSDASTEPDLLVRRLQQVAVAMEQDAAVLVQFPPRGDRFDGRWLRMRPREFLLGSGRIRVAGRWIDRPPPDLDCWPLDGVAGVALVRPSPSPPSGRRDPIPPRLA